MGVSQSSPSPLRLLVVADGTNLRAVLNQRGLTTHINYRQLAIQIAKTIPTRHGVVRWRLERVVYVTAPPIQSHDPVRYERWRKFEAMLRRQEKPLLGVLLELRFFTEFRGTPPGS